MNSILNNSINLLFINNVSCLNMPSLNRGKRGRRKSDHFHSEISDPLLKFIIG
uniref:Uncharacterized protein n=1 Tax=Meloidogyne enterolobii TaxID=390850 RepID=A0A6V7YBH2_MELEN|nr:unnamed protein product [Meloidogyne enterolobii]